MRQSCLQTGHSLKKILLNLNFILRHFLDNGPDLGAFPVEVPQTLVLGESRLFLIEPEP